MSKFRLTKGYVREFPVPMSVSEGDSVEIIRKNDGIYPGWYWCRSEDGVEAWVPSEFFTTSGGTGTMLRPYNSWELNASKDEVVEALYSSQGWAWCRKSDGEEGWLPVDNLLQVD